MGSAAQRVARHAGRWCTKGVDVAVPSPAVSRNAAVGGLAIGEACRERSVRCRDGRCSVAPTTERDDECRIGGNVADFATLDDVAFARDVVELVLKRLVLAQLD